MQRDRTRLARSSLLFVLTPPALAGSDVSIDFGAAVHEVVVDAARSRLYVTVPSLAKVVIVSTSTWQIEGDVSVSPSPHGIDLSIDGEKLYVAKNGVGAVAVLDPDTWSQSEILLSAPLGSALTYDVVEATPDRLYVSASPSSGGIAYIVQVAVDQGNAAKRVASDRIIRCNPTFEVSPDRTALYVGECFSPQSLYKLDLTHPDAPIVAEDDHGAVSGTHHVETSLDSARVHLASGQILSASTLDVVGLIASGISRFDADHSRIFVVDPPNEIETWNVQTQTQLDSRTLPCSFSFARELVILPGETGFLVLGADELCGTVELPPCVASTESYCASTENSSGEAARIAGIGEPRIAENAFHLAISGAPGGRFGQFFFGRDPAFLPFGDGWMCVSPFAGITRYPPLFVTDAAGAAQVLLDFEAPPLLNGPIHPFESWCFQGWFRDPTASGSGLNTTDGLRVSFCP